MNQIYYFTEPNRLKLIWQSMLPSVRTKFVVGELVRSVDKVNLTYFRLSPDFGQARSVGFVGYPAFPIEQPVHHFNVLELFSRRIPPRSRADFQSFLDKNRLSNHGMISDFALLGYSGAQLPSDGFSLAIDFIYENLPYQFLMELAGFRYHSGMSFEISYLSGQPVEFVPEDGNIYDPHAVQVRIAGITVGYVPRYYSQNFRFWMSICSIHAVVERIDGSLEKPRVYLMTHILSSQQTISSKLLM